MKGVVFTEFFALVEDLFGIDMVDDVIDDADPESGGAYAAVGTYSHREMADLVTALSSRVEIPVPDLLRTFGEKLFAKFATSYPALFEGQTDAFNFIENVESYIHVEVRKLYPDAELPRFETIEASPNKLVLLYISTRHLEDFAHGLMIGALAHFDQEAEIHREPTENGIQFTLTRE